MGLVKKMEWFKWIRKYSGILQDTKTGSMETLIDSASSKTINYAYTSPVIADDEFINAAAPPQQRPMLPPPNTSQESPTLQSQLPNDVYDCCVALDGIPIKQEFQYTLSDTNSCGKIAKHDIEGLASKILESMYGTTLNTSSPGQRTVKFTLKVQPSAGVQVDYGTTATMTPSWGHRRSRDRKHRSSTDKKHRGRSRILAEPELAESDGLIYGVEESPDHYKLEAGPQVYRRDQLVEMVQKSLAENLSFQNLKEAQNRPEGYHRTRTRRRQSSAPQQHRHAAVQPSSAAKLTKPTPKVAWSPYDFEPVAHVPSHYHQKQHRHRHGLQQQQQQPTVQYLQQPQHEKTHHSKNNHHRHRGQHRPLYERNYQDYQDDGKLHRRRVVAADTAVVSSKDLMMNHRQKPRDAVAAATAVATAAAAAAAAQEHTKNIDHQRYKRARLASKKIHHHVHEHHHYHHYDYYEYIV